MQRKDIDENEFADLKMPMVDVTESPGAIHLVMGRHPTFGALILIAANGAYAVLGNDVHLVVGRDEVLEEGLAEA